jgi:Domain of unknown function (DUF6468)
MDLLMNGLLVAASLFAGGYCWVLGRRVRDLKALDKGLGGAIVTLTRQIELARTTLEEAKASSKDTRQDLAQLVSKAEGAANQLRLLLAAAPSVPRPAVQPAAPSAAKIAPPPPVPSIAEAPKLPEPPAVPHIRAVPDPEPELAETPAPHAAATQLAEVPKPRVLAPIENPLRRRDDPDAPQASEDDILEALSALAGGR